eukprot:750219-Alexandrium_andersonii.AAC.1
MRVLAGLVELGILDAPAEHAEPHFQLCLVPVRQLDRAQADHLAEGVGPGGCGWPPRPWMPSG